MRRLLFTVAATVLVAGAVPASALAHHHHKHHVRAHHIRRFGDQTSPPTSTSPSDNAGTVQSFSNGVLTIALNGGSTVSGTVTNDTELECTSTQQSSTTTHDDGDPGNTGQSSGGDSQSSGGDSQGSGGDSQSSSGDSQSSSEDQNDRGDNQGEDQGDGQSSSCSTANLTPGAVVHEASLRIDGSGATWQKVELVS